MGTPWKLQTPEQKKRLLDLRRERFKDPKFRAKERERQRIYARGYRNRPDIKARIKQQRRDKPHAPHKNRPQTSAAYREAIIYFLINRDGLSCGFCGETVNIREVHIDHIIPKNAGGKNRLENFRLSHPICNSEAGGRMRRKYP